MSSHDVADDRPVKKRRFFVDDSPEPETAGQSVEQSAEPRDPSRLDGIPRVTEGDSNSAFKTENVFDVQEFETIIGQTLPAWRIREFQEHADNDLQRAVNMYLDGFPPRELDFTQSERKEPSPPYTHPLAYQEQSTFPPSSSHAVEDDQTRILRLDQLNKARREGSCRTVKPEMPPSSPPGQYEDTTADKTQQQENRNAAREAKETKEQASPKAIEQMPLRRYIGAFGVTCWATRSGTSLIRHGDSVNIERAQPTASKLGKGSKTNSVALNKRQDTVVRFTNTLGEEIGRLETESAAWVAPLIDQHICKFEGSCVYVPDRVRTNDTIYLQLRCYMLKKVFESNSYIKPQESNRQTGIFEAKETQEERNLHLRQVALVRLFNEINLSPSRTNESTEKHKRRGILKAAEISEQYEQKKEANASETQANGGSSPPSDEAEDGQELEQDQLDTLYRKAQSFDFNTPEFQPAETFAMDLRKYQKQALYWMIKKEKDEDDQGKEQSMHPLWEEYVWPTKDVNDQDLPDVKNLRTFYVNPYSGELSLDFPVQEQNCLGGVLADEMGLGKTIEMLSLMHSHKSSEQPGAEMSTAATVNNLPRLPKNSSSVESAPATTLVVAPMSLLAQWQSEAEKASQVGTLKVLVYYGSDKAGNLQHLCCEANAANAPNLIITSYGVVLSEFNQVAANGGNRGSHGGLFSLNYFRVILDEAHYIKNRQAKTSKACYEIAAKHRWVLTGTPIVNRLEDLFSLVHFLKVEPWSNFSFWKTFITVPFESGDYVKALDVVQTVLEPLVMRRTKDMKTPDGDVLVPLPTRTIEVEKVELSKDEREVYNLIFGRARRTFSDNVAAGTLMKSYTTIFAQILRLRQSCCHPILTRNKNIVADEEDAAAASDIANGLADDMDLQALIERFTADEGEQDASKFGAYALKQIQDEASSECPICCEEPMNQQAVTGCWHSACRKCLVDYVDHQRDKNELPRCFNCREPINSRDIFEVVRYDEDDLATIPTTTTRVSLRRINHSSSAKITALLSHLTSLRRTNPAAKSVVFSQFTSFLDLLQPALAHLRFTTLRFDGSMPQKQRAAVLASFSSSESHGKGTVLLLSLRAGGVGLNLTAASHVFMMDPWWAWAVENQAIDRVHRMGQDKEVRVVRFVCAESIEEKMLRIQERKKFIASSLGMMSEEEKRVQRIEDIRELLS